MGKKADEEHWEEEKKIERRGERKGSERLILRNWSRCLEVGQSKSAGAGLRGWRSAEKVAVQVQRLITVQFFLAFRVEAGLLFLQAFN